MDYKHKHDIDLLCRSIIMSGLNASSECIPITRSRTREDQHAQVNSLYELSLAKSFYDVEHYYFMCSLHYS